jgi:hypothetical protein
MKMVIPEQDLHIAGPSKFSKDDLRTGQPFQRPRFLPSHNPETLHPWRYGHTIYYTSVAASGHVGIAYEGRAQGRVQRGHELLLWEPLPVLSLVGEDVAIHERERIGWLALPMLVVCPRKVQGTTAKIAEVTASERDDFQRKKEISLTRSNL